MKVPIFISGNVSDIGDLPIQFHAVSIHYLFASLDGSLTLEQDQVVLKIRNISKEPLRILEKSVLTFNEQKKEIELKAMELASGQEMDPILICSKSEWDTKSKLSFMIFGEMEPVKELQDTTLAVDMANLLFSNQGTDCEVVCSKSLAIKAHRAILNARCKNFQLHLEFEPLTVLQLLVFLYAGTFSLHVPKEWVPSVEYRAPFANPKDLIALLRLAKHVECDSLQEFCEQVLIWNLYQQPNPSKSLEILALAKEAGIPHTLFYARHMLRNDHIQHLQEEHATWMRCNLNEELPNEKLLLQNLTRADTEKSK